MTAAALEAFDTRDVARARDVFDFLPELRGIARQVGALLLRHLNTKTGRCDPGIDRIARVLGCSRAAVFRALRQLEDLELIGRYRHGGAHATNAYRMRWTVLRRRAEAFEYAFNTGTTYAPAAPDEVAAVRAATSHGCEFGGLTDATQTPERTSERTPEEQVVEATVAREPEHVPLQPVAASTSQTHSREGGSGSPPPRKPVQTNFLLPLAGGKTRASGDVARSAAASRMYDGLKAAFGEMTEFAIVLAEMTEPIEQAGIEAEMRKRGTGAKTVLQAMIAQQGGRHGAQAAA